MASLDSLEPRTPEKAADYLESRARQRLDGKALGWSLRDATAVKALASYVRATLKAANVTPSTRAHEHRLAGAEKALADECANSLRLAQENARLRELLALARGGLYIDLRDEIDTTLGELSDPR